MSCEAVCGAVAMCGSLETLSVDQCSSACEKYIRTLLYPLGSHSLLSPCSVVKDGDLIVSDTAQRSIPVLHNGSETFLSDLLGVNSPLRNKGAAESTEVGSSVYLLYILSCVDCCVQE